MQVHFHFVMLTTFPRYSCTIDISDILRFPTALRPPNRKEIVAIRKSLKNYYR